MGKRIVGCIAERRMRKSQTWTMLLWRRNVHMGSPEGSLEKPVGEEWGVTEKADVRRHHWKCPLITHSQGWHWDSQSPPVSFPFPLLTSGGTLQTRRPYPLTVKINFKADQLIGKMWINYCAWMTRKFDLPLKLNLCKWMMGRNWKGRGTWGWVGVAGWYSSEFIEGPQTRICQRGRGSW